MANTTQKSTSKGRKPARAAANGRAKSSASRSRSAAASRARSSAAKASSARATTSAARKPIAKLAKPAIAGGAAVAAIVGGIALGAKARAPKRRLPSLPSMNGLDVKKLDPSKVDLKKARKQVASASKQFGALTKELRKAGEQAERIGDALS